MQNSEGIVKSSNFFLKLLHCPEVFSRTRSAMMLGFSVCYSRRLPPWNKTWKFLSKFCYSGKMMHICQCHWVKKCCFKCHPDFHRNLSYTTFTFGFIIKKLQELCFWGLFYSIVGLSHYCKNQFLCIEYLPSLLIPLDKLMNYEEKTAFSEQSKFPHFS